MLVVDLALFNNEATGSGDHLQVDVTTAFSDSVGQKAFAKCDFRENLWTIHPRDDENNDTLQIVCVDSQLLGRYIELPPEVGNILNDFRCAAIIDKFQLAHWRLRPRDLLQFFLCHFVWLVHWPIWHVRQFLKLKSRVPIKGEVVFDIQNLEVYIVFQKGPVLHQSLQSFDVFFERHCLQIVN